jgi:hypothetical protein
LGLGQAEFAGDEAGEQRVAQFRQASRKEPVLSDFAQQGASDLSEGFSNGAWSQNQLQLSDLVWLYALMAVGCARYQRSN